MMFILGQCLIKGVNRSLLKVIESEDVPLLVEALVPVRPLLAVASIVPVLLRRV